MQAGSEKSSFELVLFENKRSLAIKTHTLETTRTQVFMLRKLSSG